MENFTTTSRSFLTQAGISSVKADTRFFLDHLNNAEDRRRFTTTYQNAWSLAALKYFGLKVISCMSLNFEVLISGNSMPWNTCYFNWWAKFRDPEKYHWQGEIIVEVYFLW